MTAIGKGVRGTVLLAFLAVLSGPLPARALTFDVLKLWAQGGTLKVCFYNGGAEREFVQRVASEWSKSGNLSFDFGAAPSYRSCGVAEFVPVRVVFDNSATWTYPGPGAAQNIPRNKPTMSLGILGRAATAGPNERRLVLQEFGHLLGFLFEEQNPHSKCLDSIDWEKAKTAIARTRDQFTASASGTLHGTDPDPASIMAFGMRAHLATSAAADACPDVGEAQLTELDKKGMKTAYPLGKSQRRDLTDATQPVPTTGLRALLEAKVGFSERLSSVIAEMDTALPSLAVAGEPGPALTLARLAVAAVNDLSANQADAAEPFIAYFATGRYGESREAAKAATSRTKDSRAALVLAAVYLAGLGTQRDPDAASTWVRMVGESKSPVGALLRGFAMLNGVGENENAMEALPLLEAAEKAGQPAAGHVLGTLYYSGRFVQLNYKTALGYFKRAAARGFAPSQRSLAVMLDQAQGTIRDEASAAEMAALAANAGDDIGRMLLGIMFADTPDTEARALALLRQAASGGAPLPNAVLGAVHESGHLGVTVDRAKAIDYYALAEGLRSSRIWLRLADLHLQGGDTGKPKALEMYRKAAEAFSIPAQLRMGEFYRDGFDVGAAGAAPPADDTDPYPVPKDPGRSLAWYTLASLYGSDPDRKTAQEELRKLYTVISRTAWFVGTDFAMKRVLQRDNLLQRIASVAPVGATVSDALEVGGSGSGVIVDSRGYVLTNAHVVDGCTAVRVKFEGSRDRHKATLPFEPNKADIDLALLKLDYQPGVAAKFGADPKKQATVFVVGYPDPSKMENLDGKQTAERGEISALGGPGLTNLFQTSVNINPGNSGGPVFDSRGNLVGIVVMRVNPNVLQRVGYAIKGSAAKSFLENLDLSPETGGATEDLTPESIAERGGKLASLVECMRPRVNRKQGE